MNKSVLKKIGILFIFLSGIGIGASGLWLAIQNNIELRYFLLEQPTGNLPQAQVAAFVQSIIHNDKTAALNLWEVYDGASSEQQSALEKRRESVVSDLVSAKIDSEYMILGIEWWTTCCEPHVTCDSRDAGGARTRVQVLDDKGMPLLYTFDVFTREQPYWGDAMGNPPRHWVIRDIYASGQEPLFWRRVYESKSVF